MGLIVQKFGGTSLKDLDRMKRAAALVLAECERGNEVVVAVSAMGGTTDRLVAMAREIMPSPPPREMDMLLATGEQISIAMLAIVIHSLGREAISFTGPQVGIQTDGAHGRARIVRINDAKLRGALAAGKIVIVAGFQGASDGEEITTLGRGGSDTTAVALAAALGAERCDIYTDVGGVFTADPRIVADARRLERITYDEMLELASMGAKVLHGRSVELAKNYDVPLRVLSSLRPGPGTLLVKEYAHMEDFVVSGVTLDLTESRIAILGVPDEPGMAAEIFARLGTAGISVDMIIQNVSSEGRNNISFTVDNEDFERAVELGGVLRAELGALKLETERDIAKLSIVGVGMKSHSGVAGRAFGALARSGINIKSVSTSEICIACLIDAAEAEKAVNAVHEEFELGKTPAPATS